MKGLSSRKFFAGALFMTAILMLASCIANNHVDKTKHRTVLVYVAADNNLSNIANSNIYSMNSCISNGMDNYNLLVFVDRKDVAPALLHIHNFKIDTIAKYPERDTSDPMVFREVIDYVKEKYESDSYGLVMWSHGTGWLPTRQLHYVAPNMKYAQSRDGKPAPKANEERINPFAPTKAFAWEDRKGETPSYSCMDLQEMADAIPDGFFDFILFDACYMGNVEVAYALRNKADYIVSSCYEIVSDGFPYHIVTRDFLNGSLRKCCDEFYDYYNSMSGWKQMAGISMVKTDELDSLARCFRKIVNEYKDAIPNMDVSDVQCFDRFTNHVFFDLMDFVDKLDVRVWLYAEFMVQLDNCVPYKKTTPYIFPGDKEEIPVNSYSGLSIYIPLAKYDASGLNDDYRETEWSRFTDY